MPRNILLTVLRSDLRLSDNLLFHLAQEQTPPPSAFPKKSFQFRKEITHLLPVYIYDQRQIEVGGLPGLDKGGKKEEARTRTAGFWRCGEHRTSFLTHSIFDLRARLQSRNSDLSIWAGLPEKVIPAIVEALRKGGDEVEAVWMTKEVNTEEVNTEARISKALESSNVPYHLLHQRSLVHPEDLSFSVQELPDVYTQFRKQVEGQGFRPSLPTPEKLKPFPPIPEIPDGPSVYSLSGKDQLRDAEATIEALVKPLRSDPSPMNHTNLKSKDLEGVKSAVPFKGGETEALERLQHYFSGGPNSPAATYKQTRNGMLGVDYSTKFSIFLAHGLLSPRVVAEYAQAMDKKNGKSGRDGGGYWILFELLWADYFFYVSWKYGSALFTLKGIEATLNPKSAGAREESWVSPHSLEDDNDAYVRWCKGETGVPLVDASQKELIQTGFMSNRSRQNVASFLTKDLGYDWRLGAEFFESFLIDSQSTWSNWGNWQYQAGVGNDPRSSRQFNVVKQAKDYDPKGDYITTWLPALKSLRGQNEVSHPWTSPNGVPEGYPKEPVVETGMWNSHYQPRRGGGGGGGGGGGRGRGGRGNGRGSGGRGGRGGGGGGQRRGGGQGGGPGSGY